MSHETSGSLENDGFRAGLTAEAGRVVLRSRNGTQMGPAFPEVVTAAAQLLGEDVAVDVRVDGGEEPGSGRPVRRSRIARRSASSRASAGRSPSAGRSAGCG
jgi:hypothetical protein